MKLCNESSFFNLSNNNAETMTTKKKMLFIIVGAILIAFVALLPRYVEQQHNRVSKAPLPTIGLKAKQFHDSLFVADLHADTLLWDRNIDKLSHYGHVDLPRMRTAGAALQVFSMVSKTPHGLNIYENKADSDDITALVIAQKWPVQSWFSLPERVYYMIERLTAAAERTENHFMLIKNQQDLKSFLLLRQQNPVYTAGMLSVEGAHALEGSLDLIDEFYARGVRFVGLTHFFDNELGGSAHGMTKEGLSTFGKKALAKMQSLGMVIDLAHSSETLFNQVVNTSRQPVLVSHTGVKGTCNKSRNLSDQQIRQIAATGGLIGIGYWPTAVCGDNIQSIVRAIAYTVKIAGIDSVALGSDFDGSVSTPFDITGLPHLTDALLKYGFNEEEVRKIMGANILRFLHKVLPS